VSASQRVVIVGGGRAGVAAAEELRAAGFGGEIAVLHDEPYAPYDRPACGKGILDGRARPQDVAIPIDPGLDVSWWLGHRAVHLDVDERIVLTEAGDQLGYDGLVIATGAAPVVPDVCPVGAPGFHSLYRLSDSWRLRADLQAARVVAVIGGGITGCEVASVARSIGAECYLVDPSAAVMTRALGGPAAAAVSDSLAREGVALRLGRRLVATTPLRNRWGLTLDDGEQIEADVVVISVGERPDTQWLSETPQIDSTNGVLCDESLRVVGAPNVVAAGTVARWPNLQYSSEPVRVGQWITAWEHGRAAARSLLGGSGVARPVTHVPRFWSQQFGLRIQACGTIPADGEARVSYLNPRRKDAARAGVLVSYHGRTGLEAVVAVNAVRSFTPVARGLLATQGPVVEAELPVVRPRLALVG
jgi:NADPH-dependent 2,4-dienoyl-CoA reductase/sulfur reductase-like enzyme